MRWIDKCLGPFKWPRRPLRKVCGIELTTLAACRNENMFTFCLQIDGIIFTQRPNISSFAPQGKIVALILVNFCTLERHVVPLGRANFHLNWCTAVGSAARK